MANQQLCSIVDRIVRLEEERRGIAADIKDILGEAKSNGYTPAAIRIVVKQRLETADQAAKRKLVAADVELIIAALGNFGTSAIGSAAIERAR